jgi:uncharacterized protein (TIGR02996 family)
MVTMSADEDGLVRALLADPWDELARNAYADWLEENGAQEQAKLMRGPQGVRLDRLEAQARQAFGAHHAGVSKCDGLLVGQMRFETFLTEDYRREGPAWMRRNHIAVLGLASGDWRRLAGASSLEHVRGLILGGGTLRNGAAEALAAGPLAGLYFLGLTNIDVSRDGLEALLRSPSLTGLVRLGLAQPEVGVGLLEALSGGPLAGRLEHLDLTEAQMGNRGVQALAGMSPLLGGLVALRVGGTALGDVAARALAESPYLGRLRGLELIGGMIGDVGKEALAGSPLLPRLHWLSLRGDIGGTHQGPRRLASAVAEVPGMRLEMDRTMAASLLSELREMLGPRLVEG